MKYSLTFFEDQVMQIEKTFATKLGHESVAFLFCGVSTTIKEKRLLVNEVVFVAPEQIVKSSPTSISILSSAYVAAIAKAEREKKALVVIHSHPPAALEFSSQDDAADAEIVRVINSRSPGILYGSVVLSDLSNPKLFGRIWLTEKQSISLSRIRIIGKHFKLFFNNQGRIITPSWADRHVKAFGKKFPKLLKKLHIGVVGAGGTGSAICEQLIRLGAGELTVIDNQVLEDTNVTRVYGSHLSDVGKPKVELVKRLAKEIGFKTKIHSIKGSVSEEGIAKQLRDCDLIFCCTDDFLGRSVLNRMAIWYLIPVIDMAVGIDSNNGAIRDITGRVTLLIPNSACLLCRGVISTSKLRAQVLKNNNPEEYKKDVARGYAPELGETDPSVIMFTTDVASKAIMLLTQMLTNFMGEDWTATEVNERFHETDMNTRVSKNSRSGKVDCICTISNKWGKGDEVNFLGRTW